MRLNGKRALVTGAGRGIGRRIARALAGEGAKVALLARSRDQLEDAARELEQLGAVCLAAPADLASEAQTRAAFGAVLDSWGGIDILVNNAAILGPVGPSHTLDAGAWLETVQINLGGCFLCCSLVLPGMIERRSGKIINLSGGGAVDPRPNFSAYAASKAAVVRFTETLAAEVAAHGIDVNAIAPGAIDTDMLRQGIAAGDAAGAEAEELRRIARQGGQDPERAAALAVHLASAATDGLTGRLISAQWDDWENLDPRAVMATDLFTLRRISPVRE